MATLSPDVERLSRELVALAAAHVITALQTSVAREASPLQSAVVTIGSIHGGEAFNVIPDEVVLLGTPTSPPSSWRKLTASVPSE